MAHNERATTAAITKSLLRMFADILILLLDTRRHTCRCVTARERGGSDQERDVVQVRRTDRRAMRGGMPVTDTATLLAARGSRDVHILGLGVPGAPAAGEATRRLRVPAGIRAVGVAGTL